MEKTCYFIQAVFTAIAAFLSAKLGILAQLLVAFTFCMIMDYLTGYMASAKEALDHPHDPNYGWSSKKGKAGIIKKFGYVCVIAMCILIDFVIKIAGEKIGYQMPTLAMFGLLSTVWYILNECLSIIENAGRMGAPVPGWLKKYIAILKGKIDKKGEEQNNG